MTRLGVHPENRGGIFPQSDTVKNLGIQIPTAGFDPDEADHAGVVTEEIPPEERSPEYETYDAYNRRMTKGCPAFSLAEDGEIMAFGTLSHCHLLMVRKAVVGEAKWDTDNEAILY